MPSSDRLDDGLIDQFIDDYFAECDEHLTVVRTNLLALESYVDRTGIDPGLLDGLARAFHSIKGLSGMVGVERAEELAHHVETALRPLRRQGMPFSGSLYAALIAATTLLEQVIAARRTQAPAPDIAAAVAQLSAAGSADDGDPPAVRPGLDAGERARLAGALGRGGRAWRFVFVSAPELAARGVNVNSVRARLQQIGELIQATPRVLAGGRVAFDFVVASNADAAAFAGWESDGIRYTAFDETLDPPGLGASEPALSNSGDPSPATVQNHSAWRPGHAGAGVDEGVDEARAAPHAAPERRGNGRRPAPADRIEPAAWMAGELPSMVTPSHIVRVDIGRLDDLMQSVGELVISRARLAGQLAALEKIVAPAQWRALQETNLMVERQLRDLRQAAMRVRLIPIGEVFTRMQFVIHELARNSGKKIALDLNGQDTEIDKLVVERMMDPLLHLVRNAVSHGLETPDERLRAGKPQEGHIRLSAATAGDLVTIEVADDGRGIDLALVAERGRAAGLLGAEETLADERLLDLLCAPGFSTRVEADLASGRGVGMAVVQTAVRELGGKLALRSEPGRGATFTVTLPMTLAIIQAVIVVAAGQTYAVPQSALREIIEVQADALRVFAGNEVLSYRGAALPILRLARLFGLPGDQARRRAYALIMGAGVQARGLLVDRLAGQREIVVRPITDPLIQLPGIVGATELGDGRPILIVDPAGLMSAAVRHRL